MSYPQGAPGGPGYPPAQYTNAQFSAPTQQFARLPDADAAGKLPAYLSSAIAALGVLVYLASFGPQFTARNEFVVMTPFRGDLAVIASLLAAMIAGAGLLPKQTARPALVGVLSLLSFLLVISVLISAPNVVAVGWGMYLVVALTAIQALIGIGVLLLDSGIITSRGPRPGYGQPPQYGQYPGGYYGQPPGQPQHGAPTHQHAPAPQRPGYPSPYGGGYPGNGPSTGGFPAQSDDSGPPTPPTGFPAYGRPSSSNGPATPAPAHQQSQDPAQEPNQAPAQHQSQASSQSDRSSS